MRYSLSLTSNSFISAFFFVRKNVLGASPLRKQRTGVASRYHDLAYCLYNLIAAIKLYCFKCGQRHSAFLVTFFWLKKVTSNKKNPYKITYKHAAICLNKNKSLFTKLRCNVRTLLGEASHASPLATGAVFLVIFRLTRLFFGGVA